MSTLTIEPPQRVERGESAFASLRRKLVRVIVALVRLFIAVLVSTQFLSSVLLAGWTSRGMRRAIWRRWARSTDSQDELEMLGASIDLPRSMYPSWFLTEKPPQSSSEPFAQSRLRRSVWRRIRAFPSMILGGLARNLVEGLVIVSSTLSITLPGCFLMLAGWKYGWDNSFYKGYEQAFIGRITAALGIVAFLAALAYLPMARAHLSASGSFKAFFDNRLIFALIRRRLALLLLLALATSLATIPLALAWIRVYNIPNEQPWIVDATPAQLARFRESYVFNTALFMVPLYLLLQRFAASIYAGALLEVLRHRPDLAENLPAPFRAGMEQLRLLPVAPPPSRHALVAVIFAAGRKSTNALLWVTLFVVLFTYVAQLYVAEFLHHHDFLIWLNPFWIHLPCPRWSL